MRRPKMQVRALAVTCPTCDAQPGVYCGRGPFGPDVHPRRIALADRTVFRRDDAP